MRFLVLLFLIPATLVAQNKNSFQPEWAYGINGGVTISNISFNPTVPQSSYMQYAGGATGRYISENHWGLQLELNYSQRGWKEYHPDNPATQYSRQLNYLELPMFTHLYFNMGRRFRLFFVAGPQVGFLLSENAVASGLPEGDSRPPYYDMKIQNKFDWGICGGGGVELRTGVGSFLLDGRYYFGLSDIFNNSKADYFAASSNKVINVKLSYLIRFQ